MLRSCSTAPSRRSLCWRTWSSSGPPRLTRGFWKSSRASWASSSSPSTNGWPTVLTGSPTAAPWPSLPSPPTRTVSPWPPPSSSRGLLDRSIEFPFPSPSERRHILGLLLPHFHLPHPHPALPLTDRLLAKTHGFTPGNLYELLRKFSWKYTERLSPAPSPSAPSAKGDPDLETLLGGLSLTEAGAPLPARGLAAPGGSQDPTRHGQRVGPLQGTQCSLARRGRAGVRQAAAPRMHRVAPQIPTSLCPTADAAPLWHPPLWAPRYVLLRPLPPPTPPLFPSFPLSLFPSSPLPLVPVTTPLLP